RRGLRRGELVVELPLKPAVKVDCPGVFRGKLGDRCAGRMLQLLRPLAPVSAVLLGERTPGGEVVEALTLPFPVCGVRELAAGRPFDAVDAFQLGPFGLPGGVAVDPFGTIRAALHLDARPADAVALPDIRVLGYRLDTQIQRIDEPA